jgi:hypothetical protein
MGVLFFCMLSHICGASLPTVESLIHNLEESERQIQTIEADFEVRWDSSGDLYRAGTWGFEQGKAYIRGLEYSKDRESGQFLSWGGQYAFDGEKLRTLEERDGTVPNGKVRELGVTFGAVPSVTTLLGWALKGSDAPTLSELLLESPSTKVLANDVSVNGENTIEVSFIVDSILSSGATKPNLAKVWLAPEFDYRPLRMKRFADKTGERLVYAVKDIVLKQVDGIWLPISGKKVTYEAKRFISGGYSMEQLEPMGAAAAKEYIRYEYHEAPKSHKLITVKEWRLPQDIGDEMFTIAYPPGSKIWDDFLQSSITIGADGSINGDIDSGILVNPASGTFSQELTQGLQADTSILDLSSALLSSGEEKSHIGPIFVTFLTVIIAAGASLILLFARWLLRKNLSLRDKNNL